MRQFYSHIIYVTAIFLLALLMHFLRHETMLPGDLLSLGALYGIGLVVGVVGNSLLPDKKQV